MVSLSEVSLPGALRRVVAPPGVLPREALRRAMPLVAFPEALPLVGRLLAVSLPGEWRQVVWLLAAQEWAAWLPGDVLFQGSQPPGPRFSAPNPQARPVLRPLEGEPRAAAPSEALLLVLLQVAPRIWVRLRWAQPHRGEWALLAGALVVWLQEVLPLVELPYQVQLVSPPQVPPHPESPRRGRRVGLLVALPRQVLVAQPIQESPPPVQQPQGLLASPLQVEQQRAKRQAVGSSPQGW